MHIFAPINVKFGTGERSTLPIFTFIGAMCRPRRGEKPIFGLLSKNNTSMAALCAGLPVTNINIYISHGHTVV